MVKLLQKIRLLLLPLSLIYGIILSVRHLLYDKNIKKTTAFNSPIICVGNLNLGGSGKTPMIEYLIKLLQNSYSVAVLSRGYKRKTKALVFASEHTTASQLGDEPFQIYKKFPKTRVAVHPDRVFAFKQMQQYRPVQVTLLDDAFQHRKITAGLNILLTPFYNIYTNDWVLPAGNLRDLPCRANKAQIIIITKCPKHLSEDTKKRIIQNIKPTEKQHVFFSYISYNEQVQNPYECIALRVYIKHPFTLVTGIANPTPLVDYLKKQNANFSHLKFADHHNFSDQEIEKLSKIPRILTTEKDFARLYPQLTNIHYLPIEMHLFADDAPLFNRLVLQYVESYYN